MPDQPVRRFRSPSPANPERDRALAAKPRLGPRYAAAIGDEITALMRSEEIQRIRRFQRVDAALRSALATRQFSRLRPVQIKAGILTIEVADSVLLSELRQHHGHRIDQALAVAGTGVSRVIWRLARAPFTPR